MYWEEKLRMAPRAVVFVVRSLGDVEGAPFATLWDAPMEAAAGIWKFHRCAVGDSCQTGYR